jgi:hypothetical protein
VFGPEFSCGTSLIRSGNYPTAVFCQSLASWASFCRTVLISCESLTVKLWVEWSRERLFLSDREGRKRPLHKTYGYLNALLGVFYVLKWRMLYLLCASWRRECFTFELLSGGLINIKGSCPVTAVVMGLCIDHVLVRALHEMMMLQDTQCRLRIT